MHDGTKVCSTCRVEKPVNCFGKHARRKDGLRGACKDCERAYSQRPETKALARGHARAARIRNPEKARFYDRRRNARVAAERAEKRAARRAAWLAEPPPATMTCTQCGLTLQFESFALDKRARWGRYTTCKICKSKAAIAYVYADDARVAAVVARAAAWSKAHPEVGRASVLRRRARIRGATATKFGAHQIDQRMAMFGYRCWICRGPYEQVDHVKPVSKGGAHMLCNLRPICGDCNLRKSGRWPLHKIPMLQAKAIDGLVPETV